ncbi:hypothetical protein ACJRO7_009179 [Eucalyptus globulus]|uniref:Uncharacterized protein n=1 Tax=Eucalyptus globulus TaxID=34317 RepID=A0ABD3IU86_EUCGL
MHALEDQGMTLLFSSSSSTFLFNPSSLARSIKSANLRCHGSNSLVFSLGRRRNQRVKRGLTCNALFNLGVPELVVFAGIAALVFEPKKLLEARERIRKEKRNEKNSKKLV